MPGFLIKQTKPKLKIRGGTSEKLAKEWRKDMRRAASNTRKQIVRDYKRATRTWKTDLDIKVRQFARGDEIKFVTSVNNPIFRYVDKGTEPHIITPKRAPALIFKVNGFVPKTKPGRLTAKSGKQGKKTVAAQRVKHPGNEPRDITGRIAERAARKLGEEYDRAIRDWTRKYLTEVFNNQ